MSGDRRYPEAASGPFPEPPRAFTDAEGRQIRLARYDDAEVTFEGLVEMYAEFDSADRAQGLPPVNEARIRDWLETLLSEPNNHNVVAWHDDRVAGHATLVSDRGSAHELAIFVHQTYQGAGIGTELVRALLGAGAAAGVREVWLTVERWNRPAVHLYEKVGFETTDAGGFETEMTIRLRPREGSGDPPSGAESASELEPESGSETGAGSE